jgi:fermentation-respiration switch protein FrsA (DUF1100 family)
MIVHGDKDAVVPPKDVTGLVDKLKAQKGIVIEAEGDPGANHFFDGKVDALMQSVSAYLDKRLKTERNPRRLDVACLPSRQHAADIGRGTPVVVGNVRQALSERTAR